MTDPTSAGGRARRYGATADQWPTWRRWSIALVVLLTVGVLGVALGSPGVAAQETTEHTVDITKTYDRTPDDPDAVNVTYTIENPEVVDEPGVHNLTVNVTHVQNPDPGVGLVPTGGNATYAVTGDTDTAVVRFENPSDRGAEIETDAIAHAVPENLRGNENCGWHVYSPCDTDGLVDAATDDATEVEPAYTYEVDGQGFVTSGNSPEVATLRAGSLDESRYSPIVVMGDYWTSESTADGTSVTVVVPDGLAVREDPQRVADDVADAAERIDVGSDEGQRYLLVVPEIPNIPRETLRAYTTEGKAQWVKYLHHLPTQNAWAAPVHEYAHTTENVEVSSLDFDWWVEGYATWRAGNISLQEGYGDYDLYRNMLEIGRTDPDSNYHRGALVLGALDRQVRLASDGENSTDDVVERMIARDEELQDDGFRDIVADEANQTVGDRAYEWVNDDSSPTTWSLSEHQSVFGPVPDPEYETTEIASHSDRGRVSIDTQRPVAVREGSTLDVTVTVANEGDAPADYRVSMREYDGTPFFGEIPTFFDEVAGSVLGTGQEDVHLNHTFETQGEYPLEVGPQVTEEHVNLTSVAPADAYNVTVVDSDATIVREHGPHDSANTTAIVGPDTSAIVYQGDEQGAHLWETRHKMYDTGSDGVHTFDPDSWIAPGETKRVRFGRYGEWGYVSALEPVEGTIPTDPDADGDYEDLDGDGTIEQEDAQQLFQHTNDQEVTDYVPAYDYNDNGRVDLGDVRLLYDEAQ